MKERRKDGMYVVEADGWGQCGSSTPKFYVVRDELEWCQPRPVIELSTAEKLERAKLSKDRGGVYFSDKNFESSLQEYSRGIDFLKRVDFAADIGSDDVKAQAISLLIPCYNNLAICHLRLKRFTDAFVAASSVSLFLNPSSLVVIVYSLSLSDYYYYGGCFFRLLCCVIPWKKKKRGLW